jgi:hypothetical protein
MKPYDQATFQGRVVEIISCSFPATETPGALNNRVMIRTVPGEPTTMIEVETAELGYRLKSRYVHVARVFGHDFPLEMLRRDHAWFWEYKLDSLEISEDGVEIYTVNDRKDLPWTVHWVDFGCRIQPLYRRDLSTPGDNNLHKYPCGK